MPSTDCDGSGLLILNLNEALLVRAVLEASPFFGTLQLTSESILKKIADLEEFEAKRDKNAKKWYEG